jgi:hypothetical protein
MVVEEIPLPLWLLPVVVSVIAIVALGAIGFVLFKRRE